MTMKSSSPPQLYRPILWALGFLICGIIIGRFDFLADFFVPALIAGFFLCAVLYRTYRYWAVIIFILFFLLGNWRIGHSLYSHTVEPVDAVFSGVVLDTDFTGGGNQRAVVRGEHPETGGIVRIMAYIQPHQRHLLLGQEVVLTGELLPLGRAVNPGGYDQFQHLRSLKIDAAMWPEGIEASETRRTLTVVLRQFRDRLAAVYDEILPMRESGVIKSMVLGDRLDMDRDLADIYRVMGIFHILSISGLHITILMVAANKLLACIMKERRAVFMVLIAAVLYCLMTGASVATVRAVFMGGVLVGAKLFYREYDLLASVSWACVILLFYEPLYLFNIGFQLSFGAVFGIGILTAPVERFLAKLKFPKRRAWMLEFRKSLSVGIAAVVSTYIVFAFHFYEIPLYSVLGNIVVMPTVTVILVLGVIVGVVGLIFMPAAYFLSGMIYYILRFYEAAAIFFSNLPFAMVRTGGGNLIVAALGVAVLLSFAYMFHGFNEDFRRRRWFYFASLGLLAIAVYFHANPFSVQKTMLYTHGNYSVMRHRSSTVIIGAPRGGEAILLSYLDRQNVNRAALLLTHPPRPQDAARLERLLPRIHTIYLPEHAEGTIRTLMYNTLGELETNNIELVFLRHKDLLVKDGIIIHVYALPGGEFIFEINEHIDF